MICAICRSLIPEVGLPLTLDMLKELLGANRKAFAVVPYSDDALLTFLKVGMLPEEDIPRVMDGGLSARARLLNALSASLNTTTVAST